MRRIIILSIYLLLLTVSIAGAWPIKEGINGNISPSTIFANHEKYPKALVVIGFDDNWEDVSDVMKPLFSAQGIPGVVFSTYDFIDYDENRLSTAEMSALVSDGWEIVTHGKTHYPLSAAADINADLLNTKTLHQAKGWTIKNASLPGNISSEAVRRYARNHYRSMRTGTEAASGEIVVYSGGGSAGEYNSFPIDTFNLTGDSFDYLYSADPIEDKLARKKELVDYIYSHGGLIIFYTHCEEITGTSECADSNFQSELNSLIDYIQDKGYCDGDTTKLTKATCETASKTWVELIPILTLDSALDVVENFMDIGDADKGGVQVSEGGVRVTGGLNIQAASSSITPVDTGAVNTLNDVAILAENFTGTTPTVYEVEVVGEDTGCGTDGWPACDTIKYRANGGSWSSTQDWQGAATLSNSVEILCRFVTTGVKTRTCIGHSAGDNWTFVVYPYDNPVLKLKDATGSTKFEVKSDGAVNINGSLNLCASTPLMPAYFYQSQMDYINQIINRTGNCVLLTSWYNVGDNYTETNKCGSAQTITYTDASNFTASQQVITGQIFTLDLDGVDDVVTVTDNAALTFGAGDWSIGMMIKAAPLDAENLRWILSKYLGTAKEFNLTQYTNTEKIRMTVYDYDGNEDPSAYIQSGASLTEGEWYFVVITYDDAGGTGATYANGMNIYINSVIESSPTRSTVSTFVAIDDLTATVKVSNATSTTSYQGDVGLTFILKGTALSQDEITEAYNRIKLFMCL